MAGYDAIPPDQGALPQAFREVLPEEPRRGEQVAAAIEAALPPAAAVPAVAPPAAVAPAVPRYVAPPPLKAQKSIVDKVERQAPVHRSLEIRHVLTRVFGPNWEHGDPLFEAWLAQARALYAQGGGAAGPHLAQSAFMKLPESMEIDRVLRVERHVPVGLNWSILLGIVWGVWYCDEQERLQYLIDPGALIRRGPEHEVFDSITLTSRLGALGAGMASPAARIGPCIWVAVDRPADDLAFYSHVCLLGRFHHSSFVGGADIAAGGEWVVDKGQLRVIGGASGHYKPEAWRFEKALRVLNRQGAILADTKVLLYRRGQPETVDALHYLQHTQDYGAPDVLLYPSPH